MNWRGLFICLLFMLSHVVGCCLLIVAVTGAPGTVGPAQPASGGHPRCPLPRHATQHRDTKQHHQPYDAATPKAPHAAEAQSSLHPADSQRSSDGCTVFNNHLVIIIMQKRDTAVNRCNCCIYSWCALTVQSASNQVYKDTFKVVCSC